MISKTITQILKKWVLPATIVAATALPYQADASDIFIGRRGPTTLQADARRTGIQTEKGKQTIYDGIAKLWTGDKLGVFGFLRGQYKLVSSAKGEHSGPSAFLAGMGPRARFKNLHALSYFAVKASLADGKAKVPLDSGSLDKKLGLFATQMIGKNYDINSSLEYAWTGENAAGVNLPNELSFGILGGREVAKKVRAAAGLTGLVKSNGDYVINAQLGLRYTFCPSVHAQLNLGEGVSSKNIPQGLSLTAVVRYNAF